MPAGEFSPSLGFPDIRKAIACALDKGVIAIEETPYIKAILAKILHKFLNIFYPL